ncbi:MAG: hypothetical protein KF782_12690, partial [Labilithrix sp.]|nr:hypothetical protein [Labilithrix sp.]
MNAEIGRKCRVGSQLLIRVFDEETGEPMERLAMSKTREILRLRWALGRSVRETARATGLSAGAVSKTE